MRTLSIFAILGMWLMVNCGGAPANSASKPDARLIARETVEVLKAGWMSAAETCLNTATSLQDAVLLGKCKEYLTPARDTLITMADAVDVWDASAQGNFPCLAASALDGLANVQGLLNVAKVKLPQVVVDSMVIATPFMAACMTVRLDASPPPEAAVKEAGAE